METIFPKKVRPHLWLAIIFLIVCALYYPSLFNFFSHDDFFNLKISRISSLQEFINFFNFFHGPEGFGFYRPLTTQVFFWIGWIFGLSAFGLHVIALGGLLFLSYLVYKFSRFFVEETTALMVTFFYATSATHFGHTYYLSAFQEVGVAIFALSTLILYPRKYYVSLLCFIAALLSKESAVVIPALLLLTAYYKGWELKKVFPYIILTLGYLYIHTFFYGFAKGDSYIWEFSPRVVNTSFWYFFWSLNVPEMLVDFVGSGLAINPQVFTFYGHYLRPFFITFLLFILITLAVMLSNGKKLYQRKELFLFSALWFLISLSPVLFLPWHKFTYELTIPLFGVVLGLGIILSQSKSRWLLSIVLVSWLASSVITNLLAYQTSWIAQGGKAAERTLQYIKSEEATHQFDKVVFYDTAEDAQLPWSPSSVLKNTLSDQNFFEVYFKGKLVGEYNPERIEASSLKIPSRFILQY